MENRLKEIRKTLGLTQTALAEMCETSLQMVQYLENGQRQMTQKWLEKFSEVLKIPVWQLLVDPKTVTSDFDRELASRFAAAPEDVQINIQRQLGMLGMPIYIQGEHAAAPTVHEREPNIVPDFKGPVNTKGK